MRQVLLALLLASWTGSARARTLDALLQRVVQNNPAIQGAKANLELAGGQRLVFHAIALPHASVGVAGGLQGGQRAGEKLFQPFAFAFLNFNQPLFNLAVPASWQRGNIEVLIAEQQLNVAVVQQLHDARVAFYTALYNRDLTTLRQKQRERLQENSASQQNRYQAGLVNRGVLVAAEVQTHALDPQIETARSGYENALLKLNEATGENIRPEGTLPQNEEPPPASEGAASQRPDLQLARLLVRASAADQRIIEAAYYPEINITISGDYIPVSSVRRDQGSGSPRRSDDIISSELRSGAAYSWRVVDNGKVSGAVAKQRATRKINQLLVQKMERDAGRDITRLRNDFRAIAEAEKKLRGASATAKQNAAGIAKNLENGISSQLEFRLAENDLLDVNAGLLALAYQRSLALAEWDRATGRYLRFTFPPRTE